MRFFRGGSLRYYLEGLRGPGRWRYLSVALSVAKVRSRWVGALRYYRHRFAVPWRCCQLRVALSVVKWGWIEAEVFGITLKVWAFHWDGGVRVRLSQWWLLGPHESECLGITAINSPCRWDTVFWLWHSQWWRSGQVKCVPLVITILYSEVP